MTGGDSGDIDLNSTFALLQIPHILSHKLLNTSAFQIQDGCSNPCFSGIFCLDCKCFRACLSLEECLYNPRDLLPLLGPH